jgi:MOSC domain-containing protein YiiM
MRRDGRTEPAHSTPAAVTGPPPRPGRVVAVAAAREHRFSKQTAPIIHLLEGLGVEGDAHLGTTDQHRSHARRDPTRTNLRQVHLMQGELFDEVLASGHRVLPGQLGENVTTYGVDLLALPVDAVLLLGQTAEVQVTGLRNPCHQIDDFQSGLLRLVVGRAADGSTVRRTGIMGVVRRGGEVRPGDPVAVVLPPGPHRPLAPV